MLMFAAFSVATERPKKRVLVTLVCLLNKMLALDVEDVPHFITTSILPFLLFLFPPLDVPLTL